MFWVTFVVVVVNIIVVVVVVAHAQHLKNLFHYHRSVEAASRNVSLPHN